MSTNLNIVKEGLLRKQGGRIKTWYDRWFVLTPRALSYYKTRDNDVPIKRLPVADITDCEVTTQDTDRKIMAQQHFYFTVTTAGRIYTLSARTDPERIEWVKAIRKVAFKEEIVEEQLSELAQEPEPAPQPKYIPQPFLRMERPPTRDQPINRSFDHCDFIGDFRKLVGVSNWSDFVFSIEGKSLPAHRAIVSARCPALSKLFPDTFDDEQHAIQVHNITAEHFSLVLDFIYGDSAEVSPSSVVHVLHAAKKYGLERLKELCQVYIRDNVEVENVVVLLTSANALGEDDVERFCLGYISDVKVYSQVITLPEATAIAIDNKDLFIKMSQVLAQTKEAFSHSLDSVAVRPSNMADDLLELLDTLNHCDVRMVCKDRDIFAHKAVLAVRMPNLLSEGATGNADHPKPFVVLKFLDVCADVVHQMLEYVYTDRIQVNYLADAYGLITLADKVQQGNIIGVCNEMMRTNLTEDSALKILMVATKFNLHGLKRSTLSLIVKQSWNICSRDALHVVLAESPRNMIDIIRALIQGEDGTFSDDESALARSIEENAEYTDEDDEDDEEDEEDDE